MFLMVASVWVLNASASYASFTAYTISAPQAGNQTYGGNLGMDFNVNTAIVITEIGVFDDNQDGLNLTITGGVFDRTCTGTALTCLTFTSGCAGTLECGHRFKTLTTPLVLCAGFQGTIVAEGYGGTERNGNSFGGCFATTNTGCGLLTFTGSSRFGGTTFAYPGTNDGGGVARYGAGTFKYTAANFYWDVDDGNAGATSCGCGNASGTWDTTTSNWNLCSNGNGCNLTFCDGAATVHFSAGSDATGSSTCITVCGSRTVGGINFQEGCVTLTGGSVTMGVGTPTIDVACGSSGIIASTLAGTSGLTKTGAGTLSLTGSISLTGDVNVNAGTISRTGAWCICNGDTHTVRCGADLLGNTTINVGRNSTGTLTVTGCGSTAGNTGDSIIVGRNCGSNGTLNVSAQADVTATTFLFVGRCSGSVGVVNVDGSGSTLTSGSGVRLGRSSSGANTINVTNCGNLSTCNSFIIGQFACSNGTLNVSSGGDVSMTSLSIAAGCGSTGAVTVCGAGSTICASGTVSVGRSAGGSTASLNLNAGSQITAPTITVYNGGSVAINADERVADAADLNLSGGTITLAANVEETVDVVTLSSSSSIVFNADADLTMTDFSMTAGQVLSITGWTNWTRYGSGQGLGTSFRVDNTPGVYDKNNISINGNTGAFDFMDGGDGYYYLVLTTPEPSAYLSIVAILSLIVAHCLKTRRLSAS